MKNSSSAVAFYMIRKKEAKDRDAFIAHVIEESCTDSCHRVFIVESLLSSQQQAQQQDARAQWQTETTTSPMNCSSQTRNTTLCSLIGQWDSVKHMMTYVTAIMVPPGGHFTTAIPKETIRSAKPTDTDPAACETDRSLWSDTDELSCVHDASLALPAGATPLKQIIRCVHAHFFLSHISSLLVPSLLVE